MENKTERKWSFSQGILSHNPVFAAGMCIAPAIFLSSTFSAAVAYAMFFTAVTLPSLLFSSFLPRRLPYAVRIVLYTFIASAVYLYVYNFLGARVPVEPQKLGVFLPMIVMGDFIVTSAETRFFKMKRLRMTADVISHVIGFDAAIIILGAVRELFSSGEIGGVLYGIERTLPLLSAPCGGFIFIAFIGAFIRICTAGRR